MPDCVRLSRQLVLSSKSRRRLDTNYEIFNKSRPPTTSSLQVQRWVKRLVFKHPDTLWNVPGNLSRNVLATLRRDKVAIKISKCNIPCNRQNCCETSCKSRKVGFSCTFRATCLATILAVTRYVTLWNFSCNFVPPQRRQNIARQVARNITQCIGVFKD